MSETRRAFSGAPWESEVGYCRALRRGDHVWVTGTVSLDSDGEPFAVGDPEAQARRCFQIIGTALEAVGAGLADIVRTRMFVIDIERDRDAFARVHGEVFRDFPPVTSMIEVSRFIGEDFLIEIEADAFIET